MAISHLCLQCGFDMAHTRARLDPDYRLRIVACPTCGTCCVRRRHPFWETFRRALRLDAALTGLFLQLVAVWVFGSLFIGGSIAMSELIFDDWGALRMQTERWVMLGVFGLAGPVLCGMWMGSALSHGRPIRVWAIWMAMVMTVLLITALGIGWDEAETAVRRGRRDGVLVIPAEVFTKEVLRWFVRLASMALPMAIVTLLAIPAGRPVLGAARWARRKRWHWRRRRRRLGLSLS